MNSQPYTFGLEKRNFSITLTNFKPIHTQKKTLIEIKNKKKINRQYSSVKNLKSIRSVYEQRDSKIQTLNKIQMLKTFALQKLPEYNPQNLIVNISNHRILKQKIYKLINSIFEDLIIYKKIQPSVRRKKTIISRLYGWDSRLKNIYFQEEQIKSSIQPQIVQMSIFNVKNGRNDTQLKSFYNKMRLFQAQLKEFNKKQQNLQLSERSQYIKQNIEKFSQKIKTLQSPQRQKTNLNNLVKIRAYSPNKVKRSLKQLLQMNNSNENGQLGIDNFEMKWQEDIHKLESLVEMGYKSCFNTEYK